MAKNLLTTPWLGRLILSPWVWRLTRSVLLLLMLAMTAWGWHQHAIPGVAVRDPLMYTNFATFFLWVLWIMGVVFVALLFGRAWCTVCPLGWLNGIFARIGLQREVPGWLRNFVPVTVALVAVQLAVYLFAIHRFPNYTAWLLALILLLTVTLGLLFRSRAFCTLLCPAGAVFGLYARLAPFELRVGDREICAVCDSRRCVSGPVTWERYALGPAVLYWRKRLDGCPVDLVPAEIRDNATCTLCLHCAQNCDKGNVRVGFRPWLADFAAGGLGKSETFFFLVLLGMVTANFAKVYVDLREAIFWAPQQASLLLGWGASGYYALGALWVTLVLPLLIVLPGYLVVRAGGVVRSQVQGESLPELPGPATSGPVFWPALGKIALACIPLVLAAHVVLAVVKLNAKGAFLPLVLQDPSGVMSYLAINVMHTVKAPGVLIDLDILKWLVLALLLVGYGVALLAARRVAATSARAVRGYFAGAATVITILVAIYGATVVQWLFIR